MTSMKVTNTMTGKALVKITARCVLFLIIPVLVDSFHVQPMPSIAASSSALSKQRRQSSTSSPVSSSSSSSTTARFALEMDATTVTTASSAAAVAAMNPAAFASTAASASTALVQTALSSVAAGVDTFFQTQPYLSAFLTCSVKATAADVIAQNQAVESVEEETTKGTIASMTPENDNTSSLDYQRTMAFLVYGGLYQGLFQELLYTVLFPAWFGTDPTWQAIATQVSVDMFFIGPIICLPIAYLVKAAFMSDEFNEEVMKATKNKYFEDVLQRSLLFKFWGIWIPVQSINFAFVPQHFRVAFIALISFFWMFILSKTSAETTEKQ